MRRPPAALCRSVVSVGELPVSEQPEAVKKSAANSPSQKVHFMVYFLLGVKTIISEAVWDYERRLRVGEFES
jgi:hypothetical protein